MMSPPMLCRLASSSASFRSASTSTLVSNTYTPMEASASSVPGGLAGFSANASMRWPSCAVRTKPKFVTSIPGTGMVAIVTPAPQALCRSIICLGSIRYT